MSAHTLTHFLERATHSPKLIGKEWEVILIEAGFSKNVGEGGRRRYYPADVLRRDKHIFEGLPACVYHFGDKFDHLPDEGWKVHPEGYASNTVGVYQNIRFMEFQRPDGSKGEGLVGNLHILEGHKWLRENMLDAWNSGAPHLFQFSIDAEGEAEAGEVEGQPAEIVTKLVQAASTDVVSRAAAGGSLMRLVASDQGHITEATRLGDFIMAEAERKGITSAQLARAAGISESTITQIMRGEIARPPDNRLRGIARALDVSMERLLNLIPENIREGLSDEQIPQTALGMIREYRSEWMDGLEEVPQGTAESEHAIHVLETNLAQAESQLWKFEDQGSQQFREQARGIKTLQGTIQMLRTGKIKEGMRLLADWIAVHPASQASAAYSFPSAPEQPAAATSQQGTKPPAQESASGKKETSMSDATETPAAEVNEEAKSALERVEKLEKDIQMREKRLVVKERVSDSGLPKTAQERIIAVLEGNLLESTDESVDAAIQTEREYIATLKESGQITGLGSANAPATDVKVLKDQHDTFVDAWMGYFGKEDENKVPRFRSFREGYWKITEAMGGRVPLNQETQSKVMWIAFQNAISGSEHTDQAEHLEMLRENWPSMARSLPKRFRESIDTASLPVTFGEAFDRRAQRAYSQDSRQDWRDLATSIEDLKDLNNKKHIIRVGAFNDLVTIAEKEAYPEITPTTQTEEEALLGVDKHGGIVIVSWEAMLADNDSFLRMIPDRMGQAAIRTLQKAVFDPLESNVNLPATSNNLISTGHNNIVASTLTYANLVTAVEQMQNQTELDSGEKLGLEPATLWVPVELRQEAVEILESTVKITAGEDSTVRSFINKLGLEIKVTRGLGLTAGTTDQAYLTARKEDSEGIAVGFLNGREEPEIFRQSPVDTPNVGLAFSADQMTLKIRHVWGIITVDFRFVQGLIP